MPEVAQTPRDDSSPGPAPDLVSYNPAAGAYWGFPSSVFHLSIPPNPSVNPHTAAWLARLGTITLNKLQFPENAAGEASDYGFPIYHMSSIAAGGVPLKVHCTEPWGTCNAEGKTVYVDMREKPEDGGLPNTDSHLTLMDRTAGKEYDFWATQWPPKNGRLDVGWGGDCSLAGNGYDGCNATASGTPLSIGIVRASDLLLAIKSPTGTLPYALQAATKCNDGFVAPATRTDGSKAGCPPEGSRLYLAMHDAEVDATSVSAIEKAILRTLDEDHYGMFITDTNGGQDGFMLQVESDLTYTSFGLPGPLATQLIPEARNEGMDGVNPYKNVYYLQLPMKGVDLAGKLKFLS
jgi:hypothetical protein